MVAKLTDVAKLAGVSPTTVSRVINKKGYLSEKTIQKVQDAMRELGYKPNTVARSLQGKSAKLVGLIFPNISNVFYAELIDHLEHQLFKHGYKTIICNSEHDSEKEREYIEMLEANQVDGIISGSHNLGIEDYNRVTAPIIAFDRNLSPEIPVVSSDNYALFNHGKLIKSGPVQQITYQKQYQISFEFRNEDSLALFQDYTIINGSICQIEIEEKELTRLLPKITQELDRKNILNLSLAQKNVSISDLYREELTN